MKLYSQFITILTLLVCFHRSIPTTHAAIDTSTQTNECQVDHIQKQLEDSQIKVSALLGELETSKKNGLKATEETKSALKKISNQEKIILSLKKKITLLEQNHAVDDQPLYLIALERGTVHFEQVCEVLVWFYAEHGSLWYKKVLKYIDVGWKMSEPLRISGKNELKKQWEKVKPYYKKEIEPRLNPILHRVKFQFNVAKTNLQRMWGEYLETFHFYRSKSIANMKKNKAFGPIARPFIDTIIGILLVAIFFSIVPVFIGLSILPLTILYSIIEPCFRLCRCCCRRKRRPLPASAASRNALQKKKSQ